MKKRWILSGLAAAAIAVVGLIAGAQPPGPGAGWDRFAERHDLDGDGVVTLEEFAASHPVFSRLDQDGDQVVTEEEFEVAHEKFANARGAGMVIRLADQNRDRQVSAEEWQSFLAAVDADGDGVFNVADLTALLPARRSGRGPGFGAPDAAGPHPRQELLAQALDRDQDGALELEDLNAIFRGVDENGDGALQSEELPAGGFGRGCCGRGLGHHRGFGRGGPPSGD